MTARNLRARVRAEIVTEIKSIAREQLRTEGTNLSLRAVARELGMVSSAVYRYFPSRDELLTALIIDCYDELGQASEQAEAAVDRADLLGRWLAFGHAVRDWALAHPSEYALIYGSPVPGYQAPLDTVRHAVRTTDLLVKLVADGVASGVLSDRPDDLPLPDDVYAELRGIVADSYPDLPAAVLSRGVTGWIQLFGAVTFELFGRFNNLLERSRRDFFDYQLRVMGAYIGLH